MRLQYVGGGIGAVVVYSQRCERICVTCLVGLGGGGAPKTLG